MKLYRVITKNNAELLINADKVELLNSGQIVFSKNSEVISVFCKETDVVCVEENKADYQDALKMEIDIMKNDIGLIDEFFMTDVFLQKNTIEDASDKLRKIACLVMRTIYKIGDFEI